MRRQLGFGVFWVALAFFGGTYGLSAQQQKQTLGTDEASGRVGKWKIINTALFVAGLGYLIYRSAPGFFNARSADIQKAIQDATGLKMDADFRSSEIDRKMASLSEEVKKLREQSAADMEREHQRVREETQHELRRIENNVNAETEMFRQRGVRRVRQRAAQAAFELAAQRLRAQAATGEAEESVQDFIHVVAQGRS